MAMAGRAPTGRRNGGLVEAHRAGLERAVQAGVQPISWVSFAFELQRDWARQETVPELVEIVFTERLLQEPPRNGRQPRPLSSPV